MLDRRLLATTTAVTVLSVVLLVIPATGDMGQSVQLQTWPSRTPTSRPKPPPDDGGEPGEPATPTPSPPSSGQEGTAVAATATPSAPTQPASSPIPSVTSLPDNAFLATAEPCATPPTALAVEAVTVHSGPGDEYDVVGRLRLLAVRRVIGRAARAPWWLVALESGKVGWIPNRSVIIHGYTGSVNIFEAPAAPGQATERAQIWNPTPNPVCPTPLPVMLPEGEGIAAGSQNATSGGEASASTAETSGPLATAGTSDNSESVVAQEASLTGDGSVESRGSLTWILVIGIAMILVGVLALLVQARASRSGSST